jgi:hypothetical protein
MTRKQELAGDDAGACDSAELRRRALEYCAMFGSKLCCFSDVKAYVLKLPTAEREKFVVDMAAQQSELGKTVAVGEPPYKLAQRWVLGTQLRWMCGAYADESARTALVEELMRRYTEALPLGAGLKPTEWQYADQ